MYTFNVCIRWWVPALFTLKGWEGDWKGLGIIEKHLNDIVSHIGIQFIRLSVSQGWEQCGFRSIMFRVGKRISLFYPLAWYMRQPCKFMLIDWEKKGCIYVTRQKLVHDCDDSYPPPPLLHSTSESLHRQHYGSMICAKVQVDLFIYAPRIFFTNWKVLIL